MEIDLERVLMASLGGLIVVMLVLSMAPLANALYSGPCTVANKKATIELGVCDVGTPTATLEVISGNGSKHIVTLKQGEVYTIPESGYTGVTMRKVRVDRFMFSDFKSGYTQAACGIDDKRAVISLLNGLEEVVYTWDYGYGGCAGECVHLKSIDEDTHMEYLQATLSEQEEASAADATSLKVVSINVATTPECAVSSETVYMHVTRPSVYGFGGDAFPTLAEGASSNAFFSQMGVTLQVVSVTEAIAMPQLSYYCDDSDSSNSIYTVGQVVWGYYDSSGKKQSGLASDECVSTSKVREYSCAGTPTSSSYAPNYADYNCPSGYVCAAGKCTELTLACTDSDEGSNYLYEKGTTRDSSAVYSDSCTSSGSLKEYYCSNNIAQYSLLSCPNGYECMNGACKPQTSYCSDSDNGQNVYAKGTMSDESGTYQDYCSGSDSVIEYFCSIPFDQNSVKLSCPSGYSCQDGACVQSASTCSDSDGDNAYSTGSVVFGGQTYSDYCADIDSVYEMTCENNGVKKRHVNCPSGYTCSAGACVLEPTRCWDSDGNNIYVDGTVTDYWGNTHSDYCDGTGYVYERVCNGDSVQNLRQQCPSGYSCDEGSCNLITAFACSDSDGGVNQNSKGTLRDFNGVFTDYCIGNDVVEYYCSSNQMANTQIQCSSGYYCSDGACVLQNLTTGLSMSIPIYSGWNLFSIPYENASATGCSEFSVEKLWWYDASAGTYVHPATLEPLKAYWFKATAKSLPSCVLNVSGTGRASILGAQLFQGWNAVGVGGQVDYSSVLGSCNLQKGPWAFNAASQQWERLSNLQPGVGYFMKVASACELGDTLPPLPS